MNYNPAIFTDTAAQTQVIPHVVHSALELAIQLNENPKSVGEILMNTKKLELSTFEVLINEATGY